MEAAYAAKQRSRFDGFGAARIGMAVVVLFPGYFQELRSARFVTHSIDEVIEQRLGCRRDSVDKYANTERLGAGPEWSDAQLAETFLHHRVLVVPILDEGARVLGVVTRSDFFKALAERLTGR